MNSLEENSHLRSPRNIRRRRDVENDAENVPLVEVHVEKPPPLAKGETDSEGDDREIASKPYPGVDDGFFNNREPHEDDNPDVETINPKQPEEGHDDDEIPVITSRAGGDGDSEKPDEVDGSRPGLQPGSVAPGDANNIPGRVPWPHPPYGTDLEFGSDLESIPDVNVYQHKKTLAQGMMDLALFSANANQLRYVLESFSRHPYYFPSIILISFSLIAQVAVGIGLIWNATYNVKDKKEICVANKINNFTVIGIFLVTIVNVFISAFGVATPATTVVTTITPAITSPT